MIYCSILYYNTTRPLKAPPFSRPFKAASVSMLHYSSKGCELQASLQENAFGPLQSCIRRPSLQRMPAAQEPGGSSRNAALA